MFHTKILIEVAYTFFYSSFSYLTVCNKDEIACPRDQSKTRCFKLNQRCDGNEQCTSRYDELNCGMLYVHPQTFCEATPPSRQSKCPDFNSRGVCDICLLPLTETTIQMSMRLAEEVIWQFFYFIFSRGGLLTGWGISFRLQISFPCFSTNHLKSKTLQQIADLVLCHFFLCGKMSVNTHLFKRLGLNFKLLGCCFSHISPRDTNMSLN